MAVWEEASPRVLVGGDGCSPRSSSRVLLQQLKAATGDGERILALVREAERGGASGDLRVLADAYGAAVDCYGQPHSTQDYEYRDLCVKRLRALCRLSPPEAREFHNRLRTYTAGRADARLYDARAAMEERLGDGAKAVKMLQEGLRVGAQPAEVLQRALARLQPTAEVPHAAETPRGGAGPGGAGLSPCSASALAVGALGRPRRILGLGTPSRGGSADASEEEQQPAAAPFGGVTFAEGGGGGGDRARELWKVPSADSHSLASSVSMMPLSPIREAESPLCTPMLSRRASMPVMAPAAATAARTSVPAATEEASSSSSAAAAPPAVTPVRSSPPTASSKEQESPRKAQKTVYVNGVAYAQVRMLGRGGSSKVYLVHGPDGEAFALKRVAADNAKQLEAFQNEVSLLQQLRDREHVIQVVDSEIDHEKGRINIVMEVGDMDLGKLLQTEPPLGLEQIQDLWRQMLLAVQVLHDARIVHSDLKPGNFLLVGGRLKVIDFGIASRLNSDTTNVHRDASVGTLSYMPPEAVKQGHLKIGRAADIWSLGIILYQMVYGRPPFAALEPWQRVLRLNDPGLTIQLPEPQRLEECPAAARSQLLEVLGRCLEREPHRRPTLPELLAHPFLRSRVEVKRQALEGVVGALMADVVRAVSESLRPQQPLRGLEEGSVVWRDLADELFDRLAKAEDGCEKPSMRSFAGLAPLQEHLRRVAEERAGPTQERRRVALRELPVGTGANAANIVLGATEGGKRLAANLAGAAEQKRSTLYSGECAKENAGAQWSPPQELQRDLVVKPGQVAETKELLMRRLRSGP